MAALSFIILFCGFVIAVTRSAVREKFNALRLAEQKKASELSLLRSQVSPHFLFNTLHNLYSLSINRPAEMPDLVLRLADLLRYSVYEAELPFVSMREEVAYLRNYIALESIRLADRLELHLEIDDIPAHHKIAPMLLIVFVENAYKHGRNTRNDKVLIRIKINATHDRLYFSVENSCAPETGQAARSGSGFGIANVIKRLELLYPDLYEYEQNYTNDLYRINLWLQTQ